MRRIQSWAFRLKKEEERSISSFFITLTYDNKHIPITENKFMTLEKTDLQKFFKRLRKRSKDKIKYFACGEYGGKTHRPHYHAIIFNARWEDIEMAWSLEGEQIGMVYYGSVERASIGYVLKYMVKNSNEKKHARDDRKPQFQVMSKGIGSNYLTKSMIRWHKDDMYQRYCTKEGKYNTPLSRYYKDKIYTDEEKFLIGNYFKNVDIFVENLTKENLEKWQREEEIRYHKAVKGIQKRKETI